MGNPNRVINADMELDLSYLDNYHNNCYSCQNEWKAIGKQTKCPYCGSENVVSLVIETLK